MNDFSLQRLLAPLKNRVNLIIGRAILTALDASGKTALLTLDGLNGEILKKVELHTQYGFESYPAAGASVLIVSAGGNRDAAVAVSAHDRDSRPTDLAEGDSIVYTSEDGASKAHRVYLKKADKSAQVQGDKVYLGGDALTATEAVVLMTNLLQKYNYHTHDTGVGPSGTPLVANQLDQTIDFSQVVFIKAP